MKLKSNFFNLMKKSQISMEVFKYIIIALVIFASTIFGYKAITGIGKSNCVSHLTILESDLKDSVRVKSTDIGSWNMILC